MPGVILSSETRRLRECKHVYENLVKTSDREVDWCQRCGVLSVSTAEPCRQVWRYPAIIADIIRRTSPEGMFGPWHGSDPDGEDP
jgi:hypothetical protein